MAEKKVMTFELLAPPHMERQPNGSFIKYTEVGAIIKSTVELDVKFANKFRRLDGRTMEARGLSYSPDSSGKVMDDAWAEKVNKGQVKVAPVSNEGRHEAGARSRGIDPATGEELPQTKEKRVGPREPTAEDEAGLGTDVTEEFDAAGKTHKVFKDEDGTYHVASAEFPDRALNKQPIKTAQEVEAFFKKAKVKKKK